MATNNAINQIGPTPAFYAYYDYATNNVTGDGTDVTPYFNQIVHNNGLCYDNATHLFTAGISGIYLFSIQVFLINLNAAHTGAFFVFSSSTGFQQISSYNNPYITSYSGQTTYASSIVASMAAGDTMAVTFNVNGGTKTVGLNLGGPTQPRNFYGAFLINTVI